MPYYDYRCQDVECGHIISSISRSIKEDVGNYTCPQCGKIMKQLFGKAVLEFHGSGFYQTDYIKKPTSGD